MKENLKKLFKYKTFYVLVAIMLFFLPTTLYMPSQAQSRAIVTAIGIDKTEDDLYEITLALISPKNGGQVAGGNMVDSGTGPTVAVAMQMLSINLGKIIGLQHCSFIIISDEVFKENVIKVLDYFIRSNNLTADAHLINCPKSAKDLISQGASSSNTSIATMNDIIQFNNDYLYSQAITIYEFYNRYLAPSNSVFVPILELEGEENEKDKSKSTGTSGKGVDSSNSESSNSSTNASSGGDDSKANVQAGNSSKLTSNGKCAIIKNGIKVREITENERIALNIVNSGDGNGVIGVKDFSEGDIEHADILFQLVDKKSSIKGYFDEDTPKIKFDVRIIVKLDEISMNEYKVNTVSGLTSYFTPKLEEKLKENLNNYIFELVENIKRDETDILFVYDNLNRFHHRKFEKYLDSLENKDNYLESIEFETNIFIRSKI